MMQPFERLEKEWAEFNGLDPLGMVACASGTAALHLALEAFRLPPGSEVIVPDFTMVACARAVTMAGLAPVFVDCDERLLMDPDLYVDAICDGRVRAVMAVHIYGRRCDMDRIQRGVYENGLFQCDETYLIEDLAEAHGVQPHPQTDAACWSFYKNKIVAGEEGGAVWFRDPAHATLARQLRSLGFTDAHDFDHVPRGHNYRMSNLHAEKILTSLANYHCYTYGWRREIESWYNCFCPSEWRMPPRDAVWVYDLRVPGMTRETQRKAVKSLNDDGIAARMSFLPMSLQREYGKCRRVLGTPTRAKKAANEVLYLPVRPGETTEADCRRAFDVIRAALGA